MSTIKLKATDIQCNNCEKWRDESTELCPYCTKSNKNKKPKLGEYKCKICGEFKADNFSVECPDCYKEEKSNQNDITDNYDLVQDGQIFNNVKVIDFDMPFSSMIVFMVKWAIASIPALIILFSIALFLYTTFLASIMTIFK